jgi:alkylation response protein AidB-like acyl-CoA dehydrogenase
VSRSGIGLIDRHTDESGCPADELDPLEEQAARTGGELTRVLELVRQISGQAPDPGSGRTAERWEMLATLAAGDLSVGRIAEAHLDALAILAEAELPQGDRTLLWGVYAAEGPNVRVDARPTADGWSVTGVKPWCSAASHLDRALVTAHTDTGRRLFAIDLTSPSVRVQPDGWVSRGLREVTSGPIELSDCPATPVGETGWYLERSGFAWGGMGVAACWYGGMVGVARALWAAGRRRPPDQIAQLHLGEVDLRVQAGRLALMDAARLIDQGRADGADGVLLAERVRGIVAAAVDDVIESSGHGLGPAPLALDEDHARRVADLQIYVRQHHAERDSARLGALILAEPDRPW